MSHQSLNPALFQESCLTIDWKKQSTIPEVSSLLRIENFIGVLKVKQTYQQDREWVERTGSFLHDANALYQQRAQSLESAEEINPKEAEELRYQAHVQEEEDESNNKFIKSKHGLNLA